MTLRQQWSRLLALWAKALETSAALKELKPHPLIRVKGGEVRTHVFLCHAVQHGHGLGLPVGEQTGGLGAAALQQVLQVNVTSHTQLKTQRGVPPLSAIRF